MSSIIAFFDKEYVMIGTDTLSCYPKRKEDTEKRPRNYTSKTFYLPQFQSIFAVTGTLQFGISYFNFISEFAFGIDIDSLVNIDLNLFEDFLNQKYPNDKVGGTIYLFGFSKEDAVFKGFKFDNRNADVNWQELPSNNFIFKPVVDNYEEKISKKLAQNPTYIDIIKELMIIQKMEDEDKSIKEQVGIGGKVQFTQLSLNQDKKILINITNIHQFSDFEKLGAKMFQL